MRSPGSGHKRGNAHSPVGGRAAPAAYVPGGAPATDPNAPGATASRDVMVILPTEIDVTNAGQMGKDLIAAIQPGLITLIADMTGTVFCDCSGISALVRAHRAAADEGAELRLVATGQPVLRVFTLTGADQVLKIYPSLPMAGWKAA